MLSDTDADLARRDAALPGLATLLDPDEFARALRRAWGCSAVASTELTYLRYKPATNCVVRYRVQTGDISIPVYAKAYGADAGSKLDKLRSGGPVAASQVPGRVLLEDRGVVIFAFPYDAKLGVLERLLEPDRRRNLLLRIFRQRLGNESGTIDTLGYKPERRFVGRFHSDEGKCAVLRFYTPDGFAAAAGSARALQSRDTLRLPTKCGGSKRHDILAFEWLPGRPLRGVLADPDAVAYAGARVGAAVAELHAQTSPRLVPDRPEARSATLHSLANTLGFLCPKLTERARATATRLSLSLASGNDISGAIHGDLYDKQILLDGDRVGIVDLDQVALGDPRLDLGLFVAHLERDVLCGTRSRMTADETTASLLWGYQRTTGTRIHNLGRYVAAGLFSLAHHPFRTHQDEWPRGTEQILERVAEILDDDAPRWNAA